MFEEILSMTFYKSIILKVYAVKVYCDKSY